MDINAIEQDIRELHIEIDKLEKEKIKIQTLINTKKMQLGRDLELLEIRGVEFDESVPDSKSTLHEDDIK